MQFQYMESLFSIDEKSLQIHIIIIKAKDVKPAVLG